MPMFGIHPNHLDLGLHVAENGNERILDMVVVKSVCLVEGLIAVPS